MINSALNVVVLTLLDPKPEEETFYEGFTVSIEQESNSQMIMKAAFTPFELPAESGASATETLFSVCTPSQPPFSLDKVLDTQRSKPSD